MLSDMSRIIRRRLIYYQGVLKGILNPLLPGLSFLLLPGSRLVVFGGGGGDSGMVWLLVGR